MPEAFLIAGTHSGVGKTSISLGIARLLRDKGRRVQTFKVGPDYLDPTLLQQASGLPCYNLDGWMGGADHVRSSVAQHARLADVALVEGVMGLFDGADAGSLVGSSAEVAQLLALPVILVVDAASMAGSVAALVKGFVEFSPKVRVVGVIANRVGSQRHTDILRESLAAAALPPLVGAIPRGALPTLESRHLGLLAARVVDKLDQTLNALAVACEKWVDIESILALTRAPHWPAATEQVRPQIPVRIGIAQDAAFHFYYPDTLEMLEEFGATLVPFSPLADDALPPDLDALYLGGGYPEAHAEALSANTAMRTAVAEFCASGKVVYAECGGLLYLCDSLQPLQGEALPMAGVLPMQALMQQKRSRLGLVEVKTRTESCWGAAGTVLRGHAFHYSSLNPQAGMSDWERIYTLAYRRGEEVTEGYRRGQVVASYAHLFLGAFPSAVQSFLQAIARESAS